MLNLLKIGKKSSMETETLESYVSAGVVALDTITPGWVDKVNLEILDVASPFMCVLGQVYGSFSSGATHFIVSHLWSDKFLSTHGFAAASEDYPEVTAIWARKIEELRTRNDSSESKHNSRPTWDGVFERESPWMVPAYQPGFPGHTGREEVHLRPVVRELWRG